MSKRLFTKKDAETWNALVAASVRKNDRWVVTMSNKDLGDVLGLDRRRASSRAMRLVDHGMIDVEYNSVNGRPAAKVYWFKKDWVSKVPQVGVIEEEGE